MTDSKFDKAKSVGILNAQEMSNERVTHQINLVEHLKSNGASYFDTSIAEARLSGMITILQIINDNLPVSKTTL